MIPILTIFIAFLLLFWVSLLFLQNQDNKKNRKS